MYIYHNANPLNKNTGDCVIRAISTITEIPWHDVFSDLAEMANINCQMMDDNVNWHSYLSRLGYKIRPINWPCAQISQFCRCFPEGQMTQEQFNQLSGMAQQIMPFMRR